ncbi:unnamed protein product [Haemonchus placei]|uniref:39S ribosomal protein L50, mitochondrial n=1 Tax=Haemonchus placei TaxID=6290 RepID=A0A0N4X548_HAEPC|nr:unnamed protein product [Haemonchus placei]
MLRRCLYGIHGIRQYNQKVDPSTVFDFIPASSVDIKDIVDLCANEFILDEPHSKVRNFATKKDLLTSALWPIPRLRRTSRRYPTLYEEKTQKFSIRR